MSGTNSQTRSSWLDLEKIIKEAVKKIGGKKENDICHYIPGSSEGYIHHFTMRKMKFENPEKLADLIDKYILKPSLPSTVPPKPRAPRGSRKRRDQIPFTKEELDLMRSFARQVGATDLLKKLHPSKDLKTIRKELLSSIRAGEVSRDLWEAYVEVVTAQKSVIPQT